MTTLQLPPRERNVVILATELNFNWEQVSWNLKLGSPRRAKELFEQARRRMLVQAYGEPSHYNGWRNQTQLCRHFGAREYLIQPVLESSIHQSALARDGKGRSRRFFAPPVVNKVNRYVKRIREIPASGDYVTIQDIMNATGRSVMWCKARLEGYVSETRRLPNGRLAEHFPPEAKLHLEILAEKYVKAHPHEFTVFQLETLTGRSKDWCKAALKKLGSAPEKKEAPDGRVWDYYPPETAGQLTELSLSQEAPDQLLTINRIGQILGVDWARSERMVKKLGINPVYRLSRRGMVPHYPPEVVEILRERINHPAAEDWLTARQIAHALGRSESWTRGQLRKRRYKSQIRRNTTGQPLRHYPPYVIAKLRTAAKAVR